MYSNVILSSKCGNAVAAERLSLDCPEGQNTWKNSHASRLLRTEDADEIESSCIPERHLTHPWEAISPSPVTNSRVTVGSGEDLLSDVLNGQVFFLSYLMA